MKYSVFFVCLAVCALCCGCSGLVKETNGIRYHVTTTRQTPYYLSTDATKVEDTCPGHDILKSYSCTAEQPTNFSCFDVYMVQGSPTDTERYTLLQQTVQQQQVTPQPPCPAGMKPTCDSFLQAMKYNLEFSWYLVNFPSSSFEQCRETYDCKRIDCYIPGNGQESADMSTLVSCVYKRNQVFFVGSEITCHRTVR